MSEQDSDAIASSDDFSDDISDDISDDDVPERHVGEQLCQSFATVTNTDSACAQFYLQRQKWNLALALNAFYEKRAKVNQKKLAAQAADRISAPGVAPAGISNINTTTPTQNVAPNAAATVTSNAVRIVAPNSATTVAAVASTATRPANVASTTTPATSGASASTAQSVKSHQYKLFKFISWNVDGLDQRNIGRRTLAVCNLLKAEDPDVVHLQEVIQGTFNFIQKTLPKYICIAGGDSDYFTATLLNRETMTAVKHSVVKFPGSVMARGLLTVEATFRTLPFTFMNSHLESCREHSRERKSQLHQAFQKMFAVDPTRTVIFGGDLNLRDKEVGTDGQHPVGIEDIWSVCGSLPECRYTWDAVRNVNIQMGFEGPQHSKPRCRFDRIYLRQSNPGRTTPRFFGFVGLERVPTCECFPSDHWGLMTIIETEK